MALEDAQRTVGLVRFRAAEYHIDPHKIGVLGFSAGGHLVADLSTHFDKRLYPAVDTADKVSCRPDFAVALYPGHLWISNERFELNPDVPVTRQTPSTFLLQAENDPVDSVNNSLVYYIALKNAGVPGRNAFIRGRQTCLWAASHKVSDNAMASVSGDLAADDRDDFGVAAA